MGDRYYTQMMKETGSCPFGYPQHNKKGKRRMAWTDEKKQQAIEMYEERNPTSENSVEIVKEIATELEESANGVRMILSKAGVYIKKAPTASASSSEGSKRTSKAQALEDLRAAINDVGGEVDEDILGKLTGKAAQYFSSLLQSSSD